MKKYIYLLIAVLLVQFSGIAQQKINTGEFTEKKKGYFDEILKGIKEFEEGEKAPAKKSFKVNFDGVYVPSSASEFKSQWFNDPVSQGNTGTCWSFSTTSFFESEVYRQTGKKVKLSEVYTVYWEYIEKAKRFIRERGDSEFGEGSEANAVTRIWSEYGIVPEDAYTGMKPGQLFHNHSVMFKEMDTYLKQLEVTNAWNEDEALSTIKSIMKHYIGEPPAEFTVDGKKYTPKSYLKDYLKLNLNDYVDIMSLKQKPYWKQAEYEVEDNWWHSADYYNVPLDDFMKIVKGAIRNGYTLAIGGDVSEPGCDGWHNAAIIPTFDIPSEYINEDARQFRFTNGTTADDHGIHLVGYMEKDGKDWFLIKDSGAGSRNGNAKGFYFYQEDYVKLKIIDLMVHKDAVKDILSKFK
jgi:bleomycin hydrolase